MDRHTRFLVFFIACTLLVFSSSTIIDTRQKMCQSETFYSLIFGMNLPTGSNFFGEVNEDLSCKCNLGLENVKNIDNSIFCGCPNGMFLNTVDSTCLTLKQCHDVGKVALDSYCVPCSDFSDLVDFNKCSCSIWKPNVCAEFPTNNELSGFSHGDEKECQRSGNGVANRLNVNFSDGLKKIYNIPLAAGMTLYIEGCNFLLNRSDLEISLKEINVDGSEEKLTSRNRITNTDCGFKDNKSIAYSVSQSGIFALELECIESTACNGKINLTVEFENEINSFSTMDPNFSLQLPYISIDKSLNSQRNSIILGIQGDKDIFNDKYDRMFSGLKEGDLILIHRNSSESESEDSSNLTSIKLRNLANTFEVIKYISDKRFYSFFITESDDYVLHIGCEDNKACSEVSLDITVDKLEQPTLRKIYQESFEFDYTRIDSPTNDAKNENVAIVGKTATSPETQIDSPAYLLKAMNIFDTIFITITGRNFKARVFVESEIGDLDLNIEPFKDYRDIHGLTYIYPVKVRIQGDYFMKFGCQGQAFPCDGHVQVSVRRTLINYSQGIVEKYSGERSSGAVATIFGQTDANNGHRLINNSASSFFLYAFIFPTDGTVSSNNALIRIHEVEDEGEGDILYTTLDDSSSTGFSKYSLEISSPADRENYKLEFTCSDDEDTCEYKYYIVRYTPPSSSGYDSSDCKTCSIRHITVNNECVLCSDLLGVSPPVVAATVKRKIGTNTCEDQIQVNKRFDALSLTYYCDTDNGFIANGNTCSCDDTIITDSNGLRKCVEEELDVDPDVDIPHSIETNIPEFFADNHENGYQVICYFSHDFSTDTHIMGYAHFKADEKAKAKQFFLEITNFHLVIDSGSQSFSSTLQNTSELFDESQALCVLRRMTEDLDDETVPSKEYLSDKLTYWYIPSPYGPHALGEASYFSHIDYKQLTYGGEGEEEESYVANFYIFRAEYFESYDPDRTLTEYSNYWSYWGPYFRYSPNPSIMISDASQYTNIYYLVNKIKKGSSYVVYSSEITVNFSSSEYDYAAAFINGNSSGLDSVENLCEFDSNFHYILLGNKGCSINSNNFIMTCSPDPAPVTEIEETIPLVFSEYCYSNDGAIWMEIQNDTR